MHQRKEFVHLRLKVKVFVAVARTAYLFVELYVLCVFYRRGWLKWGRRCTLSDRLCSQTCAAVHSVEHKKSDRCPELEVKLSRRYNPEQLLHKLGPAV